MNSRQENKAQVTRYTVFHHALVRCWAQLARELIKQEILPEEAAEALVAAFERTLAANEFKLLQPSPFTQRTLWVGEQVNFKPDWAKRAWSDLMLSSLAQKTAQESVVVALEKLRPGSEAIDRKKVIQSVRRCAIDAVKRYLSELDDQTDKYVKRYYADILPDVNLVEELRTLYSSGSSDDRKQFDMQVEVIASERFADAQAKLLAYLGLKLDELGN